ncbi:helix-turn-helix transcriptional regulator [Glycomyces buryatensis]|uniref:WYL domain-containing protein n=1 Tax=Glycomyces buryatensis TaxID=2570927 RepID=A0A4S8QJF0_9ACTN|nr:WYL domain-containing protein [Glycomyces buryatensis]THV40864.1 WYL domain-containing protein [Glycomyces buryatensis]
MTDTAARLLLLLSLLQSRPEWAGPDLAERLGVNVRTVRRDIDRLRELGYPVDATKGPGAAYRLGAGADLPPLLFDGDQAVAVALALQLAPQTVTGSREAAARALTTIRQVMPAGLRHKIDTMQVTSVTNSWEFLAPPVDATALDAVSDAVRRKEVLQFDYAAAEAAAGDAWAPPLRVEPHHLLVWSGRWYLVAWDLDADEWRTFRVDRITPRMRTGLRFSPRTPPAADLAEYVRSQADRGDTADAWECYGEAVLETSASLVARWAPGGAIVEELGPKRCRLTLGAWSWIGLAALFGTFEADFEVIGPPELIDACAELAQRYKAAGSAIRETT